MNDLIPQLRFPEFEGDIPTKKFEDVFDFLTGKNIKQKEASPEFITPCVRYGELYHMYSEVINEVINKTNLPTEELLFSDGDEILLPSAGEDPLDIGSASALKVKGVAIGRTINILKPKIESIYSQEFASYYINQKLRRKISSLAKGVSISNVYNSDLKALEIRLPSLPEQTKIANFLTEVDKRINLLQKKKEQLEQYKKGVMQKLFSQEIRFKKDDGSDFPDWEEKKLGEICNYLNGGSFEKLVVENGAYNLITLNSIDINGKLKDYHKKVNETDNSLNKGDLVMVLSDVAHGDFLGLTDIIPNDTFVLNQRMGALKPKIEVNRYYLKTFINYNQKYFKLMGQGSSQQNLSKGDILKFIVLTPHNIEQERIANVLSSIDKSIEKLGSQIEQSQEWKQGLLQKMFV